MPTTHNKRLADIERRQANMVQFGTIAEVNHKLGRYRVKLGEMVSDWIPDCQSRAGKTRAYEGRDIGEQVVIASQSGDLAQAVIIGSVNTAATQPADKGNLHTIIYPDGSRVDYDDKTHAYKMQLAKGGAFSLQIDGGAQIEAKEEQLEIKAPKKLTLKVGNAQLEMADEQIKMQCGSASLELSSGGVTINGEKLAHKGKNIGADHKHKGVETGGGISGEPV